MWSDIFQVNITKAMNECNMIQQAATTIVVRFSNWLESQLEERTPSERVILLQRLLALKMWLVPPHMAHIFGFCGTWRGPGRCQNFGKSFQIVARANLAAPPVCPLFQITFFLQDFSRFAIVFAARGCFIFVPSYFQLLQSTSTSSAHFFH